MSKIIDPYFLGEIFSYLVDYVPITIGIAVLSMFLASIVGVFVVVLRDNNIPVLGQLASLYVLLGRALPSMLIIYIVFFGIPALLMGIMGGDGANAILNKV